MKSLYFENKRKPKYRRFSQDEDGISGHVIDMLWIGGTFLTLGLGFHVVTTYWTNVRKNKREAREKVRMAREKVEAGNYEGATKLYDEAAKLYEKKRKIL